MHAPLIDTLVSDNTGTESLGTFYDKWLIEAFGRLPQKEEDATCSDCAMCKEIEPLRYIPSAKCCTFEPILANYLVGGILSQDDAASQAAQSIQSILDKSWVTPRGISRSAAREFGYRQLVQEKQFGRTGDYICPYFDRTAGQCGIWKYRNAVCSTWFCKMSRGAVSLQLWEAIRVLLTAIEDQVSLWCAHELRIPSAAAVRGSLWLNRSAVSTVDGFEASSHLNHWGEWQHNRGEFFRECYKAASALAWDDVLRIGGVLITALSDNVADLFDRMQNHALPQRAMFGRVTVMGHFTDTALVSTYKATDPQVISLQLLTALRHFRGQPIAVAVKEIEESDGLTLDFSLLERLLDFRILVGGNDDNQRA